MKRLLLLLLPTLAFALTVEGPDEEDRAEEQARMEEQLLLYQHSDGNYEAFREKVAELNRRYEERKRRRFEEAHGGADHFVHSWE
ncbi:MAG: hypothetical protein AB7F31_00690 [Parachlamydiales bacterium]